MPCQNSNRTVSILAATAIMLGFGTSASAVPILGTIDLASNYSLVHAIPLDSSDDWLWFDPDQEILMDLAAGVLTLDGAQSFTLGSISGATATIEFTAMYMDLNDVDGFLNGTLDYFLDGQAGQFVFTNSNYGASPFNSSTIVGNSLSVYAWGGDNVNDLGIDLGISGTIPEPSTLLLMAVGMLGLRRLRQN